MKKEKIISKIELYTENIKKIKELCEHKCNIRKKILYEVFIPEIADSINDFLKKDICHLHQQELYEKNLLLDIYNKRLINL